jgi:hypothetical protein
MVEFCSRIVTRVGILLVHMHTYKYWGVAVEGGTAATVSTAEPRAWCHWKHLHGRFLQSRDFLQAESVCSGVSGTTNVCTFCWPLILHSRFLCWGFPGSKRLLGLGHPSILQIRTQCSAIDYDNRLWNKADSEGLKRNVHCGINLRMKSMAERFLCFRRTSRLLEDHYQKSELHTAAVIWIFRNVGAGTVATEHSEKHWVMDKMPVH